MPSIKTRGTLKPQMSARFFRLSKLYQQPIARVSTALLLTISTIVFFAAVAIRPTLATIAELIREIEEQTRVKEQLDQKAAALATAQSEYLLIADQIYLVDQAIPSNHQITLLLRQIESTAGSLQIPIENIRVEPIDLATTEQPETEGPISIPISINMIATYDQLNSFLNIISNLTRVTSIETIDLSKEGEPIPTTPIKMNIKIKAFFMPEQIVEHL